MSPDDLKMPACHSADIVLLMADRYTRASAGMIEWATLAKQCIEFFEGKQWSDAALKALNDQDRPAFKFNKIRPLVRLVLGYFGNHRTDAKLLPGYDGSGTQDIAECLTRICKVVSEINQENFVDTEVFLDGLLGGRGYVDTRMVFDRNDLGEIQVTAQDPFSIKLDPEADQYDLNTHGFIMQDRWVTIDEVAFTYGKSAAAMVAPMIRSSAYMGGIPSALMDLAEDITPWRTFAGSREALNPYMAIDSFLANAYDPARKTVRLVDCQHQIRVMQRCFIDLDTGAREPIPDSWDEKKIGRVLEWTAMKYRAMRQANPIRAVVRPMKRVRWTTMVGDLVVWDNWSPYESYTISAFFPYFRRGKTSGMVEDLIDPQMEINKRRSSQIDAVTRTANSGWTYHERSLDERGKQNIEANGATPGVNIEWRGEQWMEPKRIMAAAPPMAMERLETRATDDLREISGINESALGQLDRVQSGRALEARQRQAVIAIQPFMDNMTRTKELTTRKKVELIQNHYTEKRIYRAFGDDGKDSLITINARTAAGDIVNDVTNGRYSIVVDESPLSASFISAGLEDMLDLIEKGVLTLTPTVKNAVIDASSIPHKEAIKRENTQSAQSAPDPAIEVATIGAQSRVEVAKIDSATQLTIHGINVEEAGAEADQNQANIEADRMQPQEKAA
jgi:hypothetical protein